MKRIWQQTSYKVSCGLCYPAFAADCCFFTSNDADPSSHRGDYCVEDIFDVLGFHDPWETPLRTRKQCRKPHCEKENSVGNHTAKKKTLTKRNEMDDLCYEMPSSAASATFKYNNNRINTSISAANKPRAAATTTTHSWYDHIAHIVRPGKRIIRVRVCEFGVDPAGFVFVTVTFYEKHKKKKKRVSPVMLISLQTMWLNNDVISDDDVDAVQQDVTNTVEVLLRTSRLSSVPALQVLLPPLEINISKLPFNCHVAVRWIIIQSNLLLSAVV